MNKWLNDVEGGDSNLCGVLARCYYCARRSMTLVFILLIRLYPDQHLLLKCGRYSRYLIFSYAEHSLSRCWPVLLVKLVYLFFFFFGRDSLLCVFWRHSPQWARASSSTRCLDHTRRRVTVDRNPLDEWSARRRDLFLTTHTQNTHNRQTSMPPVGFEPTISAGERPHTDALDRAATGTGETCLL